MCQGVYKSKYHAPQKVDTVYGAQDIGMKLYWNFEKKLHSNSAISNPKT